MNTVAKTNSAYPSIFDTFFGKDILRDLHVPAHNGTAVAVNIVQNGNGYRIEIAAPGLKKSDFKLNLENNQLTISGHKEEKEEVKDEKFVRREFKYNSFQRTFTLPNTIDTEKIEALYEEGILSVLIPIREEVKAKPAREIAIV